MSIYFTNLPPIKMIFDLSLYFVTDSVLARKHDFFFIIEEAIRGGASLIQLREKHISNEDFIQKALKVKEITTKYAVPLIINDNIEVALACDAEGLHIGNSDLPSTEARKIIGKNKIIGLSVESLEDVEKANLLEVEYLGISPVFSTNTKSDIASPFGLEGIKKAKERSKHRLVAIGGINKTNAESIIKAGSEGIAVVSEIMCSENPFEVSKFLRDLVKTSKTYV